MLKSKCRSNCATHTQTIIKFSRLSQISSRDFVRGVWVPLSQINKRIRRILFVLFTWISAAVNCLLIIFIQAATYLECVSLYTSSAIDYCQPIISLHVRVYWCWDFSSFFRRPFLLIPRTYFCLWTYWVQWLRRPAENNKDLLRIFHPQKRKKHSLLNILWCDIGKSAVLNVSICAAAKAIALRAYTLETWWRTFIYTFCIWAAGNK